MKAYSNAASLSLRVNGRDMGKADCPGRFCLWPKVPLAVGKNRLSVIGQIAGRRVEDTSIWRRPATSMLYAIPAGVVTVSGITNLPIGSDAFFEGGRGHNLSVSGRPMPGPFTPMKVSGGSRPELVGGWRSGSFRHVLPAGGGRYTLRLHFFEPDETVAAGNRLFDIVANDRVLLAGLDVRKVAGAAERVIEREFAVESDRGRVTIAFKPLRGDALVSAIELVKQE